MNRGRWIARAGTLVLLLGFFMPTMLVSCSGMAGYEQSFSLSDLASQADQPLLYIFLLAVILALLATFFPQLRISGVKTSLYTQIGAIGAGLLAMVISLLSLSNQVNQGTYGMFEIKPAIGMFFLVGGLIVFVIGWWEQWNIEGKQTQIPESVHPGNYEWDPSPRSKRDVVLEEEIQEPIDRPARLEPIRGVLPRRTIVVDFDDFTIGRSPDNSLVIQEKKVSRHHARLRYAAGAWFIQDCDSSMGIFVNGENVPATRLESGDEIDIAGNVMIFRC